MALIIVSLLSFLCMLCSPPGSSNQLLDSKHKISLNITLSPHANHNVNGVYQLLPKNKLSWRELYSRTYIKI